MTIVYADRLHSHTVYHLAACASACKRTVVDHGPDVERFGEMALLIRRTAQRVGFNDAWSHAAIANASASRSK
jgi:hypothetical protein